jgi:rare lipoprotein A
MRSRFTLRGMRTVQLFIVVSTLALPASAYALTTSTAAGDAPTVAHLPVRITPRHVAFGHPVRVTGHARDVAAGERIVLEAAHGRHARWREVATTQIGRFGRFAMRARLRHSGVLRAVAVAHPAAAHATSADGGSSVASDLVVAGGARARAVSRVAPVKVQAAIRVARRSRAVIDGRDVALTGRLLPGRAGRHVAVQAHSGRGWQTVSHARTGARGRFAARFSAPAGANRHLRVVFAGDSANARATGAAGLTTRYEPTVASWYEDAGNTACGFHAQYGVANKSLPCGTKVTFRNGASTVTATVDDRGPYVYGRTFDLNQTTAAALHFQGVGTVYASIH